MQLLNCFVGPSLHILGGRGDMVRGDLLLTEWVCLAIELIALGRPAQRVVQHSKVDPVKKTARGAVFFHPEAPGRTGWSLFLAKALAALFFFPRVDLVGGKKRKVQLVFWALVKSPGLHGDTPGSRS